jgi:DHA1 family tetracycline resistance protein-like MFS transporter
MKRSPLLVIFITIFIDLIGFGIVIPVLPLYAEGTQFGATPFEVGLLFASYSIMQLIFSPILGGLSDRFGRRPILFFSLVGTGLGFLIIGLANSLWMLFAGRILDGITGGNISTAQAYIADVTKPEERAKGMGLVGAAFGLGFIFGPAIGGTLSRWGIAIPFLFAAGLAFANATMLYFVLPETVTKDHPARESAMNRTWSSALDALKNARLALILAIYFLQIVSFAIMTATFALFTQYRFDYDARQNGYLFAFVGIVAVVLQGGLLGRLVKMFGEALLVIAGALILALALMLLPFVGPQAGGVYGLLGVLFMLAVGDSLATTPLRSLASRSASASEQGSALGVMQSVASLARAVGPLIGGWLLYSATSVQHISDHSLRVTFWTAATLMFIVTLLSSYFAKSRAAANYAQDNAEVHV